MLRGLCILLTFQCAGELIILLTGWPFPGPVIGMLLLFCALQMRGEASAGLTACSQYLIRHLSLFFLPAGVGIFFLAQSQAQQLPAMLVAIFIGTLATLWLTGSLFQALLKPVSGEDQGAGLDQ